MYHACPCRESFSSFGFFTTAKARPRLSVAESDVRPPFLLMHPDARHASTPFRQSAFPSFRPSIKPRLRPTHGFSGFRPIAARRPPSTKSVGDGRSTNAETAGRPRRPARALAEYQHGNTATPRREQARSSGSIPPRRRRTIRASIPTRLPAFRRWRCARATPNRTSRLIHVILGQLEPALVQLETFASVPSRIDLPPLGLDPSWAPLRSLPRFQRLTR